VTCGCAGLPPAPIYPTEEAAPGREDETGKPGLESDPPQPLTVYPGDVVSVTKVSQQTETITQLTVDETGTIHLPLGGDVEVGGRTLSEAESRIEKALRDFDKFVEVSLAITNATGHQATVLGAVKNPGQVALSPGMRLADLVAQVGGPLTRVDEERGEYRNLADLERARLYRDGRVVPVSLPAALRGKPKHNIRIRPGDHLYIPPENFDRITVLGAVNNSRTFRFREGLRLTEALATAGGTTIDADHGDIRIVRGDLANPNVYRTSLDALVAGDGPDVRLHPGDVVFVTDHWIADVGEVFDRLGPLFSTVMSIGLTAAVIATTDRVR
jgi:polysaccharide export outer membrane protein